MKKIMKFLVVMILMVIITGNNFAKTKYRNKNYIIKETKIITLKKNTKGHILYVVKKGRYRIKISPNMVDYVDSYIVGESEEFNPTLDGEKLEYEIDTNKVEVFRQEYKIKKVSKIKIEIEKIE